MVTFRGGQKLDGYLTELAKDLTNASEVRVGLLAGSTYPDGTSVPLIAAINEFGAPSRGQPPRPFFRNMITAKSGGWGDGVAQALAATDNDARKALEIAGEGIKGQLAQSIVDLVSPPLAPSTIARKGFDKPLIDSGHMLNSIGVEVK